MVSAGCTISPPMVSVFIRDEWVIRGVKYKFLKYEAAGYHYVDHW